MNKTSVILCLFLISFAILTIGKQNVDQKNSMFYGEKLGVVQLPISCGIESTKHIERGLALLHHMTYEDARTEFVTATELDSNCSMGYWGRAMTYIHPLWSDTLNDEDFIAGQSLLNKAKAIPGNTDVELAYLNAAYSYYAPGKNSEEKTKLSSFEKGWKNVHQQYPNDIEATLFYALAHLSTADLSDKSYVIQKQSGALAESVLLKNPNHPGAHHYIIHAYDYPELAEKALPVAHNYSNIAPEIPHALHMPTHIFTRLGLWDDSILMNIRSADAALKHPVNGKITMHYLHALDYLTYAYLQKGDNQKAMDLSDSLFLFEDPIQEHIVGAYHFAAIPARLALEQKKWNEAALLSPRVPSDYPWEKYPSMEAVTYFAKALGAARSGQENIALDSLHKLEMLRDQASESSEYWAEQVEIQRLSALAWLQYEQGNKKEGMVAMQKAAQMEAAKAKRSITPGEVLPAQELYADMLMAEGRYKEAQSQYEASLNRSANRFNALYGAGRAAELSGNAKMAVFYYQQLVDVASSHSEREELKVAKQYLNH